MYILLLKLVTTYIISSCNLPTKFGIFKLDIHRINNLDIPVLCKNVENYNNNLEKNNLPLVRVHDACMTSEIFSSLRCDCDEQLQLSMKLINKHNGIIIYTPNEGRGIGIANKINAYNIQDTYKLDTYEANLYLNLPEDSRDYSYVPNILKEYNINQIKLLTNSKLKIKRLRNLGIKISQFFPVLIAPNKFNKKYLLAKRKMNMVNNNKNKIYCSVEDAIKELKNNKPIIITDNEDRENEGDLIYPAETITQEIMAFIIKYTSGLICCAMHHTIVDNLKLSQMVSHNTDVHKTAFTLSVDYNIGTTTGISAKDRAITCNKLYTETSLKDFTMPGHMFPLRANPGGLKERQGHTEASVKMCELAGFKPAAVISEITSDDKIKMADKYRLEEIATKHSLKIISISKILEYLK